MPIVTVEIVGEVEEGLRDGLAQRLADSIGEVLWSRPQGTWVRVRRVDPGDYAENGGNSPGEMRPVFLSLIKRELGAWRDLEAEASKLAEAVADCCGRPSANVHIVYEVQGAGRVAFGGDLLPPLPS